MKIKCPVRSHAISKGDTIAIRTAGQTLSFRQLDLAISEHTSALRGELAAGSYAAILAGNSIDYVTLLWAMFRLGATAVPLNPRQSEATLTAQVRQAGAKVVFFDDKHSVTAKNLGGRVLSIANTLPSSAPEHIQFDSEIELDSEQLSTICFTSGSGGPSKGAQLSLGNHYYSAVGSNDNIQIAPGDCWQLALPLCHVGGLGILFRAFIAGAAVFIDANFDARSTNERIDHKELTHLSLVPTMLRDLISDRENRAFPASLKAILLGGAAVPNSLLKQALALQAPIVTSYGMTETASQVTATRPGDPVKRIGTSGRLLNHRRIKIVGDSGATVASSIPGNILVGGEVLFKGYAGLPGSSAATDDWFDTSDIGYLDDEGYLTVVGRRDRMFISGGENIHPEEIERSVLEYPGILAAACIAVPDERWGQRPVLVIETTSKNPEFSSALRNFLAERLARMHLPDRIIPIRELPRTVLGKIDFTQLRQMVGAWDSGQSD